MIKDEYKKQMPFSTYDFLGYLIPGSTFIATGYFFDKWLISAAPASKLTLEFSNFAKVVQDVNTGSDANAFNSIMAIFLVFVVCYTVGHIIATLSSFFIDRYLIKSGFRYPLINFLNKDKNNEIVTPERIFKTRARFALFLGYLFIVMALQMTLIQYQLSLLNFIWYLVVSTAIIFLVFSYVFPQRLISILSYFPNKLGIVINNHLDMSGRMDGYFAKRVIEFVKKDFGIDLNRSRHSRSYSNVYWLMFLKVSEKSPNAQSMLINWHHLYSYARNTSTSFFLIAVYMICTLIVNGQELFNLENLRKLTYLYSIFFITSIGVSFILLIRYYYLFSSYYTKFLVRSYFYISNSENQLQEYPIKTTSRSDTDLGLVANDPT